MGHIGHIGTSVGEELKKLITQPEGKENPAGNPGVIKVKAQGIEDLDPGAAIDQSVSTH